MKNSRSDHFPTAWLASDKPDCFGSQAVYVNKLNLFTTSLRLNSSVERVCDPFVLQWWRDKANHCLLCFASQFIPQSSGTQLVTLTRQRRTLKIPEGWESEETFLSLTGNSAPFYCAAVTCFGITIPETLSSLNFAIKLNSRPLSSLMCGASRGAEWKQSFKVVVQGRGENIVLPQRWAW